MSRILNEPILVFMFSLVVMVLSVLVGVFLARKVRPVQDDERDDLGLVINASLTLLALIIGFSFSMP